METDQAEQLNALLSQSTKVVKNLDIKETDVSTTSKWENKSPCHFDN